MKTQIDLGIFSYCGMHDVQSHLIYDVEGDHKAPNARPGWPLRPVLPKSSFPRTGLHWMCTRNTFAATPRPPARTDQTAQYARQLRAFNR